MTKRPTTPKTKKTKGGNLTPLAQEPYVASGGYGATEYGTDTHGVAGAGVQDVKVGGGDCGCNGGQPPSPEPAGGAVFGGKSRKNKQYKIPGLLFLEQLGTPKKRRHSKTKSGKRKNPRNKSAKRKSAKRKSAKSSRK
jgi:hypothetical protein